MRPTAAGGCSPIARRRRRARATRSRIAKSSSRCIPRRFPTWGCAGCAASSARCANSMLDAAGDESPLAVILTPGPYNETYFEHAYLARQLGMPLVEGHDLTVRGDTVYLKTLGGLRRVHSILRRLDDDFCDPLELRGDSALGVPGLIGALRAGRVMVSNALGTGVLESAAWLGFLPPIAERLIGEKLLLPEIATWWLGEKPALEYVLANLDRLVIKPTYPNQRFEPMFGREFEGKARDLLIERLRNRPYAYVAQEHVRLSQAPVWKSAATSELAARALTIRVYAVVTPDGRARDAGRPRARRQRSGRRRGVDAARRRRQGHLGAQRESARGNARRISPANGPTCSARTTFPRAWSRISSGSAATPCAARTPRACCCGRWPRAATRASGRMRGRSAAISARCPPKREVFDALRTRDSQGLQADVKHLAWCASQVRNRLSARYWRGVVGLQRQMQEAMATRGSSREVYERVLLSLAALTGFSEEDMMHDEGWRVMRLGRRIERMQFVASILMRQLESRARDAARGGRVAARRLRQHAYLPRALSRRPAAVADAEPAAVRRWASDGAGVPSPFDRSRPRRAGAQPGRRARARRARRAAVAARVRRAARCRGRGRRCGACRSRRRAAMRSPRARRTCPTACRGATSRSSIPTRTRWPHEPP